jgi:hypothetical protein
VACTAAIGISPAETWPSPTSNYIALTEGRESCLVDTLGPAVVRGNANDTAAPTGSWIGRVGDVYQISLGSQVYAGGEGDGNATAASEAKFVLLALNETFSCDAPPPCEFPPREPEPVPTVSEWGMIVMSFLLIGTAAWFIRRRNRNI